MWDGIIMVKGLKNKKTTGNLVGVH